MTRYQILITWDSDHPDDVDIQDSPEMGERTIMVTLGRIFQNWHRELNGHPNR